MYECSLYEEIYRGTYKEKEYSIYNIEKDEEQILVYLYVVVSDETLVHLGEASQYQTEEEYAKSEMDLIDKAIDVRKLSKYNNNMWLIGNKDRDSIVIPLIKEAVENGEIVPI
ncbi:MAG: hypothetical protein UH241_04695 [Acutalibacteraceae bacterium]|nr:hypothetical protein [Acutalibacteraceae bacterium]